MSHPIVALWAHPRSMSTATERIMRERGDCEVFHEPFLADYYLHRSVRPLPMLDEEKTAPMDYNDVRSMLLEAADAGPVFFKDMSYYVVPRIFEDEAFAHRLCNVFLVRDPRRSIASYYKLDPQLSLTEIGIEAQWRQFCFLRDALGAQPLVIEAEAVSENPKSVIGRLWEFADLPFKKEAFEWRTSDVPEGWQHVEGWHADVLSSSGIRKDASDPDAVFEAAAAKAPHLKDFLEHHWGFYERLKAQAGTYSVQA
ncbi:hypothetical protein [Pelagibius sp. Alg239-R121]|uniref:sulfotransferase-like domain-containing protein n=1 Tax=Pelagibius sp. Alg239-R121 TaxID=2993448 RepID=UPI0024A6AAB0|nr:hypothetical protein [Pelagibius sp. Alg239-R121]